MYKSKRNSWLYIASSTQQKNKGSFLSNIDLEKGNLPTKQVTSLHDSHWETCLEYFQEFYHFAKISGD